MGNPLYEFIFMKSYKDFPKGLNTIQK